MPSWQSKPSVLAVWSWVDQDGGPGHVGTLVTIGRLQHAQCPAGTVRVVWDQEVTQARQWSAPQQHSVQSVRGVTHLWYPLVLCCVCWGEVVFAVLHSQFS